MVSASPVGATHSTIHGAVHGGHVEIQAGADRVGVAPHLTNRLLMAAGRVGAPSWPPDRQAGPNTRPSVAPSRAEGARGVASFPHLPPLRETHTSRLSSSIYGSALGFPSPILSSLIPLAGGGARLAATTDPSPK